MDETKIDRAAMGRLAKALAFICGADHPTTVALEQAAKSGSAGDIKTGRAAFLRAQSHARLGRGISLGDGRIEIVRGGLERSPRLLDVVPRSLVDLWFG